MIIAQLQMGITKSAWVEKPVSPKDGWSNPPMLTDGAGASSHDGSFLNA
jgi:hypothetical protein